MIIIYLFSILITGWFLFSSIYIVINGVAGFFYKKIKIKGEGKLPRVAVFIPAYKEDAVIVKVAHEALKQKYEGDFEVIVISDSLKKITNFWLQELPLSLICVAFDKSTKAKALNYALKVMGDSFDLAIVLDADNVMERGVVQKFAEQYMSGNHAVQGHRCAKNTNAKFALLDAISEEVNNHIYCKGPAALKLSSRLVGSGMAFDYTLFKKLMRGIEAVGGFDKDLELKIIKQKVRIQYAEDIVVYDEKVQKAEVFGNQRTRWISAQYHYMIKRMPMAISLLFKGNFDYFYKAIQLCLPPRLLLPGFLAVGSVLFWVVEWDLLCILWTVMFISVTTVYLIAIPVSLINKKLVSIPFALIQAFAITFLSLFKLLGANKKFIHTPHSGLELGDNETKKH
ncbi:MAG: cellulose synthase/poly-beta-1,6-N-acetylglucosamine synthase-like glycosyltransferase [Glaciecola sp.]|jgi:cellulose synthase/poly-beta-1,6-N-acetylglucosamine synthase-like glycosyltransferase